MALEYFFTCRIQLCAILLQALLNRCIVTSWTLAIQSVAAFSLAKPSIASVWPPQIISTTQVDPALFFCTLKTGGSDILQIFASAVPGFKLLFRRGSRAP